MAKHRFEPCQLVFEVEKTPPGWSMVIYLERANGDREEQRRERYRTKREAQKALAAAVREE